MRKNYRKIDFGFGDILSAVKQLNQHKQRGELVYGEFNGQKLYSDKDDLDSAYKKIIDGYGFTPVCFLQLKNRQYKKQIALKPMLYLGFLKKGF